MPTVIQADKVVAGVAMLSNKGDTSHKLPRHCWPIVSAKATYGQREDFGSHNKEDNRSSPITFSFMKYAKLLHHKKQK